MRILITGGNGQLGTQLAGDLRRGFTELGDVPEALQNPSITSIDINELDISDMSAVRGFISSLRPEIIINCAAYTNVDGCEQNREAALKANAIGPRNLAVASDETGAKLVHISTDYVFSGKDETPRREWDICAPQSAYGCSKLLGEQYVRGFCRRWFIIRTAWLYGYTGNNFVRTIIKLGREKGAVKVVSDQRGNPTSAADLSHHVLLLAASGEYGLYHCTNNGTCSWYDFARKIISLANIECEVTPCSTEEFPRPAKRPAFSSLENAMLKATVGDYMRGWEEALEAFFRNAED